MFRLVVETPLPTRLPLRSELGALPILLRAVGWQEAMAELLVRRLGLQLVWRRSWPVSCGSLPFFLWTATPLLGSALNTP